MRRIGTGGKASERANSRQTPVAGLDGTFTLTLKMCEELQHVFGSEVADGQLIHGLIPASEGFNSRHAGAVIGRPRPKLGR